jgi:hypothetical protein
MPSTDEVRIVLRGVDRITTPLRNVRAGVRRLDQASKAYTNTVRRQVGQSNQLVSTITKLAGAFSVALLARNVLNTAVAFEKYETALNTVLGSSERAKKAMDWIVEFTATTPFELQQVTNEFVNLSARGFEATKYLRVLGDTASSMGKTLNQAVEAFTDAATGEFERLKEFGIRARVEGDMVTLTWVQNGQEMQKAVQKTQSAITQALSEIWSGRFEGGMERFMQTFAGLRSNLKDMLTLILQDVMGAGPFELLKEKIADTIKTLKELKESGDLTVWGKDLADAMTQVGDAFFEVAKYAGQLIKLLLPYSGTIVKVVAAWVALKAIKIAIIGPIRAVIGMIQGLNAALLTMTGLNLAGWFNQLRTFMTSATVQAGVMGAAFQAAAGSLVVFFATDRVIKAIGAYKELAKAQKELTDNARMYGELAEKTKQFADVGIKSAEDLKKFSKEEMDEYLKNLRGSIDHYDDLRAKFTQLSEKRTAAFLFGGWKSEQAKDAERELVRVDKKLRDLLDAYREAHRTLKNTDAFGNLGQELDDAGRAITIFDMSLKGAQKTIDSMKLMDLRIDPEAVTQSFSKAMAQIDSFAVKMFDTLARSTLKEEDYKNAVQYLQGQVLTTKQKVAEEALQAIRQSIDKAKEAEQGYLEEVKKLEGEIVRSREHGEDLVRDLRRQTMTEEQAYWDRRKQAQEKLTQAQTALTRGDYDRVRELGRQAEALGQSLARGYKDEAGNQVVDEAIGVAMAIKTVREANDLVTKSFQRQKQEALDNARAQEEKALNLQKMYEALEKRVGEFRKQLREMASEGVQVKVEVDDKEAQRALDRLSEDRTVVLTVLEKRVPAAQAGGFFGPIRRFADGGWNRVRGSLPGWGGGDRIKSLLEAGEFVIRKEVVRNLGVGFFDMLNRFGDRIPKPQIPRTPVPAFAQGGSVQGFPLLGRVEITLPGGDSMEVLTTQEQARRMEKVLQRRKKTRS